MKEKMGDQISKSGWMSAIFFSIGVVAAACIFIPGVNLVAAAALAVTACTGVYMADKLEGDRDRCKQFVLRKISGC